MAFNKLIPRKRKNKSLLSVGFALHKNTKTTYANIYISEELFAELGWGQDSRAFVYIDDENPMLWMVEGAPANDKDAYKISCIRPGKMQSRKITFKFSNTPLTEEKKNCIDIKFVISPYNSIIIEVGAQT